MKTTATKSLSRIMAFASTMFPAPQGAQRLGAVDHPVSPRAGGELLLLASGIYVIRQADTIRTMPQRAAHDLHEQLREMDDVVRIEVVGGAL